MVWSTIQVESNLDNWNFLYYRQQIAGPGRTVYDLNEETSHVIPRRLIFSSTVHKNPLFLTPEVKASMIVTLSKSFLYDNSENWCLGCLRIIVEYGVTLLLKSQGWT